MYSTVPEPEIKPQLCGLPSRNRSLTVNRGPARVNSDKRHGPKSSNSAQNEIATRDNLPWPNCVRDGKADNK